MGKAITIYPCTRIWREDGKIRISIDGLSSTEKTIRLTIGENTEDGKLLLNEIFTHRVNYLNDLHPDVEISARPALQGGLMIQRSDRQHPLDLWNDGTKVQLRTGPDYQEAGNRTGAEQLMADAQLLADVIQEMGWRDADISSDEPILSDLIKVVSGVARVFIQGSMIAAPAVGDISLVHDGHYFYLMATPHTYEQVQALYRLTRDFRSLSLILDLRTPGWDGQAAMMRSLVQERRGATVVGHVDDEHLLVVADTAEVLARATGDGPSRVLLSEPTENGEPIWAEGGAAAWVRRVMFAVESLKDDPISYDFGEPKVETVEDKTARLFAAAQYGMDPHEFVAILRREGLLKT